MLSRFHSFVASRFAISRHRIFYMGNPRTQVELRQIVLRNGLATTTSYSGQYIATWGGAIMATPFCELALFQSTIESSGCTGTYTTGGGIAMVSSGRLSLLESTLNANTANHGAAVYVGADSTVTMRFAVISGSNYVTSQTSMTEAGALFVGSNGVLTVDNSTFSGNTMRRFGGGLFLSSGTVAELADVLFESNFVVATGSRTSYGGAIYSTAATVDLQRCQFIGNGAGSNVGGAIYQSGGSFAFTSYRFFGNFGNVGYQDMHKTGVLATGATFASGCPAEAPYNWGKGVLGCYNCHPTFYPADLTLEACRTWSAEATAENQWQLEQAVMHDRLVHLAADLQLNRAVAVLGYLGADVQPLTGLVLDGHGHTMDGGGVYRYYRVPLLMLCGPRAVRRCQHGF